MLQLRKSFIISLVVGLVSIVSVADASAMSVKSKPSKPVINSVSVVQSRTKGNVDVIIRSSNARMSKKSPLLLTEVRVGTFRCNAKKSTQRCTVKNLPANKVFTIRARAQNKNGYGRLSNSIRVRLAAGTRWSKSESPSGVVPAPVTSYVPFVSVEDPAANLSPATTLQFDLTGAVGLAIKPAVASTSVRKSSVGSNLLVVLESGVTREALSVGSASISKFVIAPNNRLYVLFNSETNFGSSQCLLAQVYRNSGKAVCLESSGLNIDLSSKSSIQFDSLGNIYYAGSRGLSRVLRRFSNGVPSDYVNQYQSFDKWLVLPDGDVIVSGYTSANGLSWTRKITKTGLVTPLAPESSNWLMMFLDGNAYFSSANCVRRFLVQQQILDPVSWFGFGNSCGSVSNRDWVLSTFLNNFWITANANVLAKYGNTDLYYLYPTLRKANQPLSRITYGIPALTSMVLVGTNKNGTNQMVLFDSSTNTSSLLADGSNEIEFYHVQLNLGQNRIYFDGLRFSDNKYVIGYLDLSSRAILTSDILTRVQDFQTFVG